MAVDKPNGAEVVVVGSGPAGISAATRLAEAGVAVLLLDGGVQRSTPLPEGTYHDLRRGDPEQWRTFLGSQLEAFVAAGPRSPKFDAPAGRFAFAGYGDQERIGGEGFSVIGSLARGGLSEIWGAGVSVYDDVDLAGFPIALDDLSESYRRVAARIGVSGFGDDDLRSAIEPTISTQRPLPLAENARRLLARHRRRALVRRRAAPRFRLGRARTAVLTEPRPDREACALCDLCVWGCARRSIYSASFDLEALVARGAVDYRPGHVVERIRRNEPNGSAGGGLQLLLRDVAGGRSTLRARDVILAAGTLSTTRLVLELLERFDHPVRLHDVAGLAFALCLPERLGTPVEERVYSMAQLSFVSKGAVEGDDAYGSLFPAAGLPAATAVGHMPMSRPGAVRFYRDLQPALLLGNAFVSSRHTNTWATLVRGAGGAELVVRGGVGGSAARRLSELQAALFRAFVRLGAILIPGSASTLSPGEAVRSCGTLPMKARPERGEVDVFGQVEGVPGLIVADLSVFPDMPAKHQTLSLMANADRIAGHVGRRILAARSAG